MTGGLAPAWRGFNCGGPATFDMTTVDLTDADLALLRGLRGDRRSAPDLAATVGSDETAVEERLSELADNALVDEREGGYELTESGRRVLESPGDGDADERIDTPPAVERELASLDLAPDAEAAVRNAFTDLRSRGRATPEELQEWVFSEDPAGYDDPERWWDDLVVEHLLALPGVDVPAGGSTLRYEGEERAGDGGTPGG